MCTTHNISIRSIGGQKRRFGEFYFNSSHGYTPNNNRHNNNHGGHLLTSISTLCVFNLRSLGCLQHYEKFVEYTIKSTLDLRHKDYFSPHYNGIVYNIAKI